MIYKSFPGLKHDTAKLIHLTLHAIAIVLGAVGIYCAFKNHNESGIANLYSLHSWLGIGAISLYGIQVTKRNTWFVKFAELSSCRSSANACLPICSGYSGS
jgi:cytochrome b-561